VPRWADGLPLIDYLVRRFPYHDHAAWRTLVQSGRIHHRGSRTEPGSRVHRGDEIAYFREQPEPPVDTAIELLAVDDDLVVACKPPHLPSHADGPFVCNTFIHLLRQRLGGDRSLHLAHRLDRETSGLLVVARSAVARIGLERQFRAAEVEKTYLAIVHGRPADDEFTIAAPIGLAKGSEIAIRRAVVASTAADARPARTDCRVLQRFSDCTLLQCRPRTGRTHQIRVHLEHLGHPLVGDKLYGHPDADYLAFVARMKAGEDPRQVASGPDRQLLHATELAFTHPRTGASVRHQSPIAADMQAYLSSRGDGAAASLLPTLPPGS